MILSETALNKKINQTSGRQFPAAAEIVGALIIHSGKQACQAAFSRL